MQERYNVPHDNRNDYNNEYNHHHSLHRGMDPRQLRENYDPPANCVCNINCLDINEHITKCPICSKFYNTDLTIYIIVIVILCIICLILLKKVLKI